jgi:ribosomal protein S18 acetylase RimI-like enzyme
MERLRPRKLTARWLAPLEELLAALEAAGDRRRFNPHPFTREALEKLLRPGTRDYYCVLTSAGKVLGYGMLRGWNEGYAVPSLGIAIHPRAQDRGFGRLLMIHLHEKARSRGARRVRLRVLGDNAAAIALYKALGYRFAGRQDGYRIGLRATHHARQMKERSS